MNSPTSRQKDNMKEKTVSETAKELQQDLRTKGYYSASKLERVFGDPRRSVEVKASTESCSALTKRRA